MHKAIHNMIFSSIPPCPPLSSQLWFSVTSICQIPVSLLSPDPPEKLSVWHKGENVSGKTFAVEEGETVNVSASVEGNPDPMVIWARADAQERENGRENGRSLIITDIRRAESTYKYNCTAQNAVGSKSVNFEIDVHCKYCKLCPSNLLAITMQLWLFRIPSQHVI